MLIFLDCLEALINGVNSVRNNQLSASSSYDTNHDPWRSRLHTQKEGDLMGSWSVRTNTNTQWIQVCQNYTKVNTNKTGRDIHI